MGGAVSEEQAVVHDYTIRTVRDGGRALDAMGWGEGIRAGHYLVLPNGERTTRYQVETIAYGSDPPDMWRATLRFAPREAQPAHECLGDPEAEFRTPEHCNHHEDVPGDCEADNQAISWERLW
jgi:hypothetical protein